MTSAPLMDPTTEFPIGPVAPAQISGLGHPKRSRRPDSETVRRWMARGAAGLAALSIFLVGFVAFGVVAQGWVQHRDQGQLQHSLDRAITAARVGGSAGGGFFASPKPTTPVATPAVALLQIPVLHLTQAVLDGTSSTQLAKGPALMKGGAEPGGAGNVVIAGHRTLDGAPFYRLDSLKRGDQIIVSTVKGRFVYQVMAVTVVPPGSGVPFANYSDKRLTLTTGDPIFSESHPLAVQALLVSETRWPNAPAPSGQSPGGIKGVPDVPGTPGGWLWLFGGLVLAAAAIAAWPAWRRISPARSDHRAARIVTAPIVLAGACLAFHGVSLLLPATI